MATEIDVLGETFIEHLRCIFSEQDVALVKRA